jgi:hypothetical protein
MRTGEQVSRDTFIKGGTVENRGDGCILSSKLPISHVSKTNVNLALPEYVTAGITLEDDFASLVFFNREAAPSFELEDRDLQSDWGGKVLSIFASPTRVLVGTDNGCIMLSR